MRMTSRTSKKTPLTEGAADEDGSERAQACFCSGERNREQVVVGDIIHAGGMISYEELTAFTGRKDLFVNETALTENEKECVENCWCSARFAVARMLRLLSLSECTNYCLPVPFSRGKCNGSGINR